ncbi:MAG: GGDEF domain-containing protein [Gammaproteobacteria bacterium]|nr:GGDEF domain-containing protein [Gammaproteobacteria bacterium]MBI5615565.1 GGDEF domain-containing protein [Gammaproteobacteria bacterium]
MNIKKTTSPAENGETTEWRTKYREVFRELEEARTQWARDERALHQSLLKLALSFESADSALDRELNDLRRLLRTVDAKGRQNLLLEISERCAAVAKRRLPTNDSAREELSRLLGKLKLPAQYQFELKQLTSKIAAGGDIAKLTLLIADLVNELAAPSYSTTASLRLPEANGEPSAPRIPTGDTIQIHDPGAELLGDLVDNFVPVPSVHSRLVALQREWQSGEVPPRKQLLERVAEVVGEILNQPGLTTDERTIQCRTLLELVDALYLPGEFEVRIAELKETLLGPRVEDPIADAAVFLNDLHAYLRRDLKDLGEYLKKAAGDLSIVEAELNTAVLQGREAVVEADNLSRGINSEMDQIGSAFAGEHSVAEIKAAIDARVSTVRGSISHFLDFQHTRQSEYEHRIEDLTQRVRAIEVESSVLRDSLQEQHAKAHKDALTGVPNRLAYEERAEIEFERAKRYGTPLSLAILDLDRFKRINDGFGHKAGDKLLKTIALICQHRVRKTDFFARYGGEEFVLLLPETSLKPAFEACEQVRRQVETATFRYKDEHVPVTVSIGVANLDPVLDSMESLFERADKALYRAKDLGRNRVEAAD